MLSMDWLFKRKRRQIITEKVTLCVGKIVIHPMRCPTCNQPLNHGDKVIYQVSKTNEYYHIKCSPFPNTI